MKWRKRKSASEEGQDPGIQVADTGDAQATGGATAVTGYQGPPSRSGGLSVAGSVSVTQTGSANAAPGSAAVTGYVAGDVKVEYHAAPQTPASWPHRVGVIPREAATFQERDETEQLLAAVTNGGTAVLCQVLRGTGGVGKTQLAAHHARQAWNAGKLDVLVWVSASSRPAIISAYAQAAEELLAVKPGDPERSAQAFLRWLEPRPPGSGPACRWLVVLDDVADPADMTGMWPAKNPHGRTVVTTRRRDVAVPGCRIDLGVFTPEQAAAYLTEFLAEQGRHDDPDQIDALAEDLGYLPLALSQAAAHIVDADIAIDCPECTHEQCRSYRRRLADCTAKLAGMLPEPGTLPDDQTTTVDAAWSMSIERADALRPAGLARPALQLAAMLDANGIPQDALTSKPARDYLAQRRITNAPEQDRDDEVTERSAWDALRTLHRVNLIDHDPQNPYQAVRVHQLTQRATRDTLPAQEYDVAVRAAADALNVAWQANIESPTARAQAVSVLRANTETLIRVGGNALCQTDGVHAVLFQFGWSLGRTGQINDAIDHFEAIAEAAYQRAGSDHPDTLAALRALAQCLASGGDPQGAVDILETVLQQQVVEHDSWDALGTRFMLLTWRGTAGDAAGATAGLKQLLADIEPALGPISELALSTRNSLGCLQGEAGDVEGAVDALEQLVADVEPVLGPGHMSTATYRSNLAHWRDRAGDTAGAVEDMEELLADVEPVLGPEDVFVIRLRSELVTCYRHGGDPSSALVASEQVLASLLKVPGPDHPETRQWWKTVATLRGEVGDTAGAVAASEQVLASLLKVPGPDHMPIYVARNNLAYWRDRLGTPSLINRPNPEQDQ
ncbi:tetratricopeptide repeat protein [Streptomyces sp. NPDC050355]|uniref:tetratricopeptide repeat protein n=1 Tax=Streptomyces sp. NPDC050355 TaxID=3365609 RepID=UPI00378EA5BF